ncbi:hypothetical protein ABZ825_37910 [Streptomyces tauricus]|uniref:hypothetical protein n=1 Tax=Streptomyces tauricus TaxID=68274 RepID=UPI0033FC4441
MHPYTTTDRLTLLTFSVGILVAPYGRPLLKDEAEFSKRPAVLAETGCMGDIHAGDAMRALAAVTGDTT